MSKFHIDEPEEIGKKKVRINSKTLRHLKSFDDFVGESLGGMLRAVGPDNASAIELQLAKTRKFIFDIKKLPKVKLTSESKSMLTKIATDHEKQLMTHLKIIAKGNTKKINTSAERMYKHDKKLEALVQALEDITSLARDWY